MNSREIKIVFFFNMSQKRMTFTLQCQLHENTQVTSYGVKLDSKNVIFF